MAKTITLVDANGKETTIKSPILGSADIKSQGGVVCVETKSLLGNEKSYCVMTGQSTGRSGSEK